MDLKTKRRFNKALNAAISSLDMDARGYCYRTDEEYMEFITGLKDYQRKLIDEIHEEQNRFKRAFEDEKIREVGIQLIEKHKGALIALANDEVEDVRYAESSDSESLV